MTIALIVLAVLLGVASGGSAIQKLRRDPTVVASMHAVGVADRQIPILAVLELAGAVGLLVGIWFVPIGIAAAIGLSLYFIGAVASHIRARRPAREAIPAAIIMVLALATLMLEVSR